MTTKSKKNPLIILIVLAIILFISAYVWKQFQVDNSEAIYSEAPKVKKIVKTNKKKKALPIENIEPVVETSNQVLTLDDRQVKRKKLEKKLNSALMLKTPEQVMEVITALQEKGRTEEADEYIEYLLKTFPDYEME
jgi:predicted negative regulator of RcsB-dependent stress response